MSSPHPFFTQSPEANPWQASEAGHCDEACRVLQFESAQMMRAPHVSEHCAWSLDIHMAE